MDIEIKIKIKTENDHFDKRELISDIKWGFNEITGYEIKDIEVKTDES